MRSSKLLVGGSIPPGVANRIKDIGRVRGDARALNRVKGARQDAQSTGGGRRRYGTPKTRAGDATEQEPRLPRNQLVRKPEPTPSECQFRRALGVQTST